MNKDELDRILLSEKQIEPSPSFTRNVMLHVQTEPKFIRPLPFPWIRFSAVMIVLSILMLWIFPTDSVVHGMSMMSAGIGKWIFAMDDPAIQITLLPILGSLAGTLILLWLSFRLVGANQ
jgi:hypothetical protein